MIDLLLYLLFLFALLVGLIAQIRVSTTFRRYSGTPTASGKTAAEVARMILDNHGLSHVRIERVSGHLTDHYDPRDEVLRLSDSVYDSPSAAAVGVAAHEAGHAVQHAEHYAPIVLRSKLVPVTNFASRASWIFILIGALLYAIATATSFAMLGYILLWVGVILYSSTAVFQLVTLPCEFNASARAMSSMRESGMFSAADLRAARKTLSAAAMTYVAALFASVVQLLRILWIFFGNRRRR